MTRSKHIYASISVFLASCLIFSLLTLTKFTILDNSMVTPSWYEITKGSLWVLIISYLVFFISMTIKEVRKNQKHYKKAIMAGSFSLLYMLLMVFIFSCEVIFKY